MKNVKLANSVRETCTALGISRATLYALWKGGKGPPYVKVGARRLVPCESLADWIKRPSGGGDE